MICEDCRKAGDALRDPKLIDLVNQYHNRCNGRCDCQHRTISSINWQLVEKR